MQNLQQKTECTANCCLCNNLINEKYGGMEFDPYLSFCLFDQEALLVKDSKDENLKAISGTDEKGGLKTVSSTAEHEQSFLKFDKQSNALENFLSNFIRQFKPPHNSTSSKSSSRVLLPVHECSPRCSKHRMLPPIMPVRDK